MLLKILCHFITRFLKVNFIVNIFFLKNTIYFQNFLSTSLEKKKSCHVSRGFSGFSLLEALFGGWLLIREDILRIFRLCKDVEYALLRYLLEDLVPLVIFFYSTVIRESHYEEWQLAIICLSIMLITQKRRHYNKSMLAAISDFMHYEVVIPEWQTVFANHLNVFTEKKV